MKKLYFLSLALLSVAAFGQSIVITKVIDGTLPHDGCSGSEGTFSPKIVELYVSGTVDFANNNYRVQTESNGAANEEAINWNDGLFLFSLGEVTDAFAYVVNIPTDNANQPLYDNTLPIFTDMYPEFTNVIFNTYAPNVNGNDAIRIALYDEANENLVSVIDQFGNPFDVSGSSDYTATWAYQDSYASRNDGVTANGGNFTNDSFTYPGINTLDGVTCTEFVTAVNLGTFNILSTKTFDAISGLKMFPNPLSGNTLNITSDANAAKTVAIYDVLGKQVVNTIAINGTVNVSGLTSGVYIVKITEEGKTATRKLVVK